MSATVRAHRTSAPRKHALSSSPRRKYRILVIDDDEGALSSISTARITDIDVVTCMSAEHALKLLEAAQFHLVCCSHTTPGMKGDQLLRLVSSMPVYTSCLLITEVDDYTPARDGGHYHVMVKPLDEGRLTATVLHLARLTEMKRSVHSMTGTFAPPDPAASGGELMSCDWSDAAPDSSYPPRSTRLEPCKAPAAAPPEPQQEPESTRAAAQALRPVSKCRR
ncbi:response regulator [Sorangium sp. So ce1036]|uniref:response regulator n=1 Tax=Sorangium sp. So ce1036 TaxID=3133328 RepID=UPI003EFF21DE